MNYELWAWHENITLAYFVSLGDPVVSLVLKCGFFSELLAFARYLWAFSVGQERHTSQHSNILVAFRSLNIGMEYSLAFLIEFERHTLQR